MLFHELLLSKWLLTFGYSRISLADYLSGTKSLTMDRKASNDLIKTEFS